MKSEASIAIRKAFDRNHVLDGGREHGDTRHQPESSPEARRSRNPEREGGGERIGEDGLHLRAGERQTGTDRDGHQGDRHADVPDHHAELIVGAGRIPDGRDHFGEAVTRRTIGHVDGDTEDEREDQQAKDPGAPRGDGAITHAPFYDLDSFGSDCHQCVSSFNEAK